MIQINRFRMLCWVLFSFASCGLSAQSISRPARVDDFRLLDYLGKEHSFSEFADRRFVVVAFLGSECPLARVYGTQLETMAVEYQNLGVSFVGINSNQQDTPTEIGFYARKHGISFPLLKDPGNRVADKFDAKRTPEVFVVDSDRNIRYRGRIDDQFGVGYARPDATQSYLKQSLDELLAGQVVSVPQTDAVGCHIGRVKRATAKGDITYANQISRLIQRRCVQCHRSDGIAPFSLLSYEDASAWAETICEVVNNERMPPWHANPKFGHFANDGRMTNDEKKLLCQWLENGVPEGDIQELPQQRKFQDGWTLGKPDLILKMPDPVTVSPTAVMDYQYVTIDPGFSEAKWIRASEIRPGVRSVVHHIIAFIDIPGADPILKERGIGFEVAGSFVPGSPPMELADGVARYVPAGSKFVLQIHYTPDGVERKDQSEIGLYFADPAMVERSMQTGIVANLDFSIPPNANGYRVEAVHRFSHDMKIYSFAPHMHYRGKSFQYELTYPNGSREILLEIPRYDFNWQNSYKLVQPKFVPEGSLLKCVAHFDNSDQNPANPDPTRRVRWGEQTWEEMMIGFFDAVFVNQNLSIPEPLVTPIGKGRFRVRFSYKPDRPLTTVNVAGTFNQWDKSSLPLTDADGDDVYTAETIVNAGEYRYKFVMDGAYWSHDPASRSLTGFLHESYFVAGIDPAKAE